MAVGSFGIIGGDLRIAYAAVYLDEKGYAVAAAGLEDAKVLPARLRCTVAEALAADAVILPLPLLDGKGRLFAPFAAAGLNVEDLLQAAPDGSVVLGGRVPEASAAYAAACGCTLLDYYAEESLQLLNALPTAEGALALLMDALPVTVWGAKMAVMGFGRTGQAVARLLQAVGARVTVFARRGEVRVLAETMGFRALPFEKFAEKTAGFDALVNTVPTCVLAREVLEGMDRNCYLLDIASPPWGFDAGAAESLGFRAQRAPALPGRAAPASAGAYIARTVLAMLTETEGLPG